MENDELRKISERLASIDKTLEKQSVQLEYHIKRTDQNEAMINKIWDGVERSLERINAEMAPVKAHINNMHGGFKLIAGAGIVAALIINMMYIFNLL